MPTVALLSWSSVSAHSADNFWAYRMPRLSAAATPKFSELESSIKMFGALACIRCSFVVVSTSAVLSTTIT